MSFILLKAYLPSHLELVLLGFIKSKMRVWKVYLSTLYLYQVYSGGKYVSISYIYKIAIVVVCILQIKYS